MSERKDTRPYPVRPGASAIIPKLVGQPATSGALFRHLVRHVCSLEPRVVGEVLRRLVPDRGALLRELRRYLRFDPAFLRDVGGVGWPDARQRVRP
jgi:hypothetical protein